MATWAARKRESSERTTLRPEESAGSRRETRPHGSVHEEIVRLLGGLPLPTVMPGTNIFEIRETLRAQPVGQCIPLWRMETHVLQSISGSKCTAQMMPWIVTRQTPSTWSLPFQGVANAPCATHRPNWTKTRLAGLCVHSSNQARHHQRHACDVPSVCGDCGVQELFETPLDAVIVADRELASCTRVQHPLDVVGTRGCAKQEEQPCALQI